MLNLKQEILVAADRIQPFIRKTPLDYSIALSKMTNCQVYLKCENLQYLNSFKLRGAINKLLTLAPAQREHGVATASTGNHGAAVAYGLNKLKINGIIFVPENAATTKVNNIRNFNIPLQFHATDSVETEIYAKQYAEKHQMVYISPYNDPHVIAGQGTIAVELMQQLNQIDVVLVPVGGGGLIAGIAGYLKNTSPQIKIIGCLPENSPVMIDSIKAGQIINIPTQSTLSDATAGGIEPDSFTFPLCQKYVDEYILVTEDEIKQAIIISLEMQHLLIEGAAGVALAALLKNAPQFRNKNVIVILSGANISLKTLRKILI